jgi:3-phosphoglycerate kinase
MEFCKLDELDINGKKIFIRCDFNVPLDENGHITSDKRIVAALPTINYALENGAKQIILASHLGKPQKEIKKGKSIEDVKKQLTLAPVCERLSELLNQEVAKSSDCIDIEIPQNKIVLLENLRFHKEEESKDEIEREKFAEKLAGYAELYVNDAFGTCHRKHASVYDITKYLKSAAGLLVQKEIEIMEPVRDNPEKPFALLLGGAKIEDKIKVIDSMYKKVDLMIIGGAMANAFFKAKGYEVGKSLCEGADIAGEVMKKYSDKIMLPVDVVLDDNLAVDADKIPPDKNALDIGPKTVELFKEKMKNAKTVFWNGPFGYFEKKPFDKGTNQIARYLASVSAKVIVGGGDTATAVEVLGLEDKFTHVSTGGGASLEFFEGEELPAIRALKENYRKFSRISN